MFDYPVRFLMLVVFGAAVLSGCASSGDIEKLRREQNEKISSLKQKVADLEQKLNSKIDTRFNSLKEDVLNTQESLPKLRELRREVDSIKKEVQGQMEEVKALSSKLSEDEEKMRNILEAQQKAYQERLRIIKILQEELSKKENRQSTGDESAEDGS